MFGLGSNNWLLFLGSNNRCCLYGLSNDRLDLLGSWLRYSFLLNWLGFRLGKDDLIRVLIIFIFQILIVVQILIIIVLIVFIIIVFEGSYCVLSSV